MNNKSCFEDLITEELNAESQVTIAGGRSININDKFISDSKLGNANFNIINIDIKLDDINLFIGEHKNWLKSLFK